MKKFDGLELVKEKLTESLSFAEVSEKDIETLVKLASCIDCESMRITWRKRPFYVRFDAGIMWDEYFHRKSKILAVKIKTSTTKVQKDLECSNGTFQEIQFELKSY
jgi:hypothetical protein